MKVKAIIEFEVSDELIQKASYGKEYNEKELERIDKARTDIFHQLVEDLKTAEVKTSYTDIIGNTRIYDYKFFIVKEEPLLFEL